MTATVLVASGLERPASANTPLQQTESIAPTDTNWGPSTTGTEPLVFQQFNPAANPGQTLQQIDISVQFQENNTYTMTFTGPSTISVTAIDPTNSVFAPTIGADTAPGQWPLTSFIPALQVQDPSGLLTKTVTEDSTATYPLTLNSSQLTPINYAPTALSTVLSSGSADFNAFVGTGTIAFPFLAAGGSTFTSSSGNGSGTVTTQAGVTMTVTYVTTQNQLVPEPSSVLLLGLGAAGLFVARRWRAIAARQAGA